MPLVRPRHRHPRRHRANEAHNDRAHDEPAGDNCRRRRRAHLHAQTAGLRGLVLLVLSPGGSGALLVSRRGWVIGVTPLLDVWRIRLCRGRGGPEGRNRHTEEEQREHGSTVEEAVARASFHYRHPYQDGQLALSCDRSGESDRSTRRRGMPETTGDSGDDDAIAEFRRMRMHAVEGDGPPRTFSSLVEEHGAESRPGSRGFAGYPVDARGAVPETAPFPGYRRGSVVPPVDSPDRAAASCSRSASSPGVG